MIQDLLLTVVIVCYNNQNTILECLDSIFDQSFTNFKLVVIDNASKDETVNFLQKYKDKILLIQNKVNIGFARAVNQGINAASSDIIFCLNPDASLKQNCLEELFKVLDRNTTCVCPKILNHSNHAEIDSVGGLNFTLDWIGMGRGRGEINYSQFDQLSDVFAPSGCAFLIRKSNVPRLELFDSRFFLYCEDLDLGVFMQLNNLKVVSAPHALVYHRYSESISSDLEKKLFEVEKNHLILIFKNFGIFFGLLGIGFSFYRLFWMALARLFSFGKSTSVKNKKTFGLLKTFFCGIIAGTYFGLLSLKEPPKVKLFSALKILLSKNFRQNIVSTKTVYFTK